MNLAQFRATQQSCAPQDLPLHPWFSNSGAPIDIKALPDDAFIHAYVLNEASGIVYWIVESGGGEAGGPNARFEYMWVHPATSSESTLRAAEEKLHQFLIDEGVIAP